jgi:hypothetical protein
MLAVHAFLIAGLVSLIAVTTPLLVVTVSRLATVETDLVALKAVTTVLETAATSLETSMQLVVDFTNAPAPLSDTYTLDANCSDGNVCTLDYLVAPRYTCAHQRLPSNTTCANDACFRSTTGTHCDAATGTCVSPVFGDCHGNAFDADANFVCGDPAELNLNGVMITNPYDNFGGFHHMIWSYGILPFYNICEMFITTLDILPNAAPTSGAPDNDAGAPPGPFALSLLIPSCRDLLDPDIIASGRDACIVTEKFTIDANVTKRLVDLAKGAGAGGNPLYRNASYQFGMCIFRYACTRLDEAYIALTATSAGAGNQTHHKRDASAASEMESTVRAHMYANTGNRDALARWTQHLSADARGEYARHATQHFSAMVMDGDWTRLDEH